MKEYFFSRYTSKMSIASHMTTFLTNTSLQTLHEAQHALLSVRNIQMDGFTQSQSRALWYSLILYKFKSEHGVPDKLWKSAREYILTSLRGQDIVPISAVYLAQFSVWKERDFQSFINDMAMFYVQLLDIKDAIERTGDRTTILEWQESYQTLLHKVKKAAIRMKCLERMEACALEIQRAKRQYVFDMMHRAYWDMLEEDVAKHQTTILVCQLNELRDILMEINTICPLDFTDTFHAIEQGTFDKDAAMELFCRCMNLLSVWDSESHERMYSDAVRDMQTRAEDQPDLAYATWIRVLMEKSSVLAMDLKIRKALWKLILTTEPGGA